MKGAKEGIITGTIAAVLLSPLAYDSAKQAYNTFLNRNQKTIETKVQTQYSTLDSLLSKIGKFVFSGPTQAYAEENAEAKNVPSTYKLPADDVILKYMNQPVEKTLEGTNVTYVNDSNYQKEVLGSDRPVIVLFYIDLNSFDGVKGSRGLAALTKILHENFPELKLCAYKMADALRIPGSEFLKFAEKYPLKTAPSLLLYDNDSGPIALQAKLSGGFDKLDRVKHKAIRVGNYINAQVLD